MATFMYLYCENVDGPNDGSTVSGLDDGACSTRTELLNVVHAVEKPVVYTENKAQIATPAHGNLIVQRRADGSSVNYLNQSSQPEKAGQTVVVEVVERDDEDNESLIIAFGLKRCRFAGYDFDYQNDITGGAESLVENLHLTYEEITWLGEGNTSKSYVVRKES